MGILSDAWQGVTNYFSATKDEVVSEWDEFQEEVEKTSSYEQSTASDILQQTANGLSFVAEAAGSVVNNKSTRELAHETLDKVTSSELYHEASESLSEVSSQIEHEVHAYLEQNPELKAHLHEAGEAIEERIDAGIAYAKEVAAKHPEALRNIGAVGAVAATLVPAAKGAKLLSKADDLPIEKYILSPERNREVFEAKILPKLEASFDLSSKEQPTLFFTGGLPGAGKSGIVEAIQSKYKLPQILIADPDAFRKFHPDIEEIQERFGPDASQLTHPDASQFAKHTVGEALDRRANIIKDGTLNSAKGLEILVKESKALGYEHEITIKAVNEYESLQGVFGRYAGQYAEDPSKARFVPPSYVKESKSNIEETAERIKALDVKSFRVIDRDNNLIYDQSIHVDASPKALMQEATDLKNYPQEKIAALENNWDSIISKLKEIDAPKHVQQSAREIRHELAKELHPVSARVMTKENAIVAGGVGTYMATKAVEESALEQSDTKKTNETTNQPEQNKPNIVDRYNLDKQAELREKYRNRHKQKIDPYNVDNPEEYNMQRRIELAERINAQREALDVDMERER